MKNPILENLFTDTPSTSLEAVVGAADGATAIEREYEIYGTVEDLEQLKNAPEKEHQEQWGIPINTPSGEYLGNLRVRKTVARDGTVTYTQTLKAKSGEATTENEMVISEDTFQLFKTMVPNGLIKTRYIFPVAQIEGAKFEVDVFFDLKGVPCNIVKIDLELDEGVEVGRVVLPFTLKDPRVIPPGKKTDDDKNFVSTLFRERYETPNPLFAESGESA